MKAQELRQKYLNFFESKGHRILPSASLVPENDPTVLFTTAGMHPLVPYLMGERHPEGSKLASVQKCIRTGDIDDVGDKTHLTFFEMLGNWSLGDYGKREAIEMSYEFLTEVLGLDKNRLAVSVFVGDDDSPFDNESFEIWKSLGIPESRIAKLPKKNNWWGPAGQTGPCGPDTEMFYWTGNPDEVPQSFNDDNDLWVEIWNDVFMIYNKTANGKYVELEQKNVDTGMGLERTIAVLNNLDDVYRCNHIWPLIEKIQELSGKTYEENIKSMRVIADHLRASVMIMGDPKGITPSNTEQGYVVRRLIRNAIRHGKQLNIENKFINQIGKQVIELMGEEYQELKQNRDFILNNLDKEENKFIKTLEAGAKKIRGTKINGQEAFDLFQTYGYPVEMTKEIAKEKGMELSAYFENEYSQAMGGHQEKSRTASAGMFKGGLADDSENTKKLHTAAHLMLSALKKVLGDHVEQRGSNINPERLRFDFSHAEKMTDEQIVEVERLVNDQIEKNIPITCEEMTLEEAKNSGATGIFDDKYGSKVKVYTVENFSKEICGGPHAEKTGDLGHFKITKEQSSSSGIRRIKATLE